MKKLFLKAALLLTCVLALTPALPLSAKSFYWYCNKNSEHKQPRLKDDLAFIEECGGIYVDKAHGDASEEKVIYLTFDVGYENGNVARILDTLKEEGVKGSFFILGNVIDRAPQLVLRMVDEGHLVCNHTLTHKNLVGKSEDVIRQEITSLENKYRELTGREMAKYFRPPEGTFDKDLLLSVGRLGYKTVFWSFAYADWDNDRQMAEEVALKKILDNLHNGEIMLLHPTGETNAKIMKSLIAELKRQGYRFATLDEIK